MKKELTRKYFARISPTCVGKGERREGSPPGTVRMLSKSYYIGLRRRCTRAQIMAAGCGV